MSNVNCCVVGCFNTHKKCKNANISFYAFPNKHYEAQRREQWIAAVNRMNSDGTPWKPSSHTKICSEHFVGGKKSTIASHPAYIPSIFPPRLELKKKKNLVNEVNITRFSMEIEVKVEPFECVLVKQEIEDDPNEFEIKEENVETFDNEPLSPDKDPYLRMPSVSNVHCESISDTKDIMQLRPKHYDDNCTMCVYQVSIKYNLTTKLTAPNGEKIYSCIYCPFKTTRKHVLLLHTATHTEEMPYECKKCSYRTIHRSSLMKHIRTHYRNKPFNCHMCDFITDEKTTLMKHIKTHFGSRPYACTDCKYSTHHGHFLLKHIKDRCGETFACEVCTYVTLSKKELKDHNRVHGRHYACHKCNYRTAFEQYYLKHLQEFKEADPYECADCDFRACNRRTLSLHVRMHFGVPVFTCKMCDFTANNEKAVLKHRRVMFHNRTKPYVCKIKNCVYKTTLITEMIAHMKIHNGRKVYTYKIPTKRKYNLRKRIEEKPFVCKICYYRARFRYRLNQHVASQHR